MLRLTHILIKDRKGTPRIDHLWMIIILACVLIVTSLVPLPPNDFWWHLKIGEIIVETGKIPQTNMFAWTLDAEHPFVYGAWFGEALIFLLFRLGGLELVVFVRTLLLGVTCALVGWEAKRRSGSWRIASLAVVIGFAMSMNNIIVRPQMWSWLPFTLYLFLLNRYSAGQLKPKWLLLCPLIMVFWVNAHGAFVLGGVLLGAFFAAELLRQLLMHSEKRRWHKTKWLAIIILFTLAAVVVNPQGPGIIGYVVKLMTDQPSQNLIVEWQSPTPNGIANIVFYVSVLIFLVVFWYTRTPPHIEDVFLVAGFLWLAWSGMRYVVWFSIISMPVLAESVILLLGESAHSVTRVGRRNLLNVVIALCVILPVVLVQPWLVERLQLPLAEKYWELVYVGNETGPLISVSTPIQAARYIESHPDKKMYNEMGYGSYFIWAIPEVGVFVDPRVELYPYEQWQDYRDIMNGVRNNALLNKYGVERIVLDVEIQENLAESLASDPLWELVYDDGQTEIWDRLANTP